MKITDRTRFTQATLDQFLNQKFAWGERDCATLVSFQAAQINKETALKDAGNYSTAIGAKRALKALGFESLIEATNHSFDPIPPSHALLGDIVAFESAEGKDHPALGIYLGGGRVLAFADVDGTGAVGAIGPLERTIMAWRFA